jgi:hypothetical protein
VRSRRSAGPMATPAGLPAGIRILEDVTNQDSRARRSLAVAPHLSSLQPQEPSCNASYADVCGARRLRSRVSAATTPLR